MSTSDEHRTHVEHDHIGWYFWCEAEDCYAVGPRMRYHTEAETVASASFHERDPG